MCGVVAGNVAEMLPFTPSATKLRLIVNKGFTPRMVERMGDEVRARACALLDPLVDADGYDLVGEYAVLLPLQVICGLLGVPESDEPWLLDCLVRTFGVSDPANGLPISERIRVMEELGAYAHELGRSRLDDPREDLTTVLVNAEVEDDATLDTARRMGVDYVQGVAVGKPQLLSLAA